MPPLDAETMPVPAPDGDAPAFPIPVAEKTRRSCPVLGPLRADAERYAEVRRLVTETKLSLLAISGLTGIAETTLRNLIKGERWARLDGAPKQPARADGSRLPRKRLAETISDTEMVRGRLLRAIDQQIDKVDLRLRKRGAEVEEKHSRILGNLAKTLGALMQMGEGGTTSKETEPLTSEDARSNDWLDRIKRWARGEQGY